MECSYVRKNWVHTMQNNKQTKIRKKNLDHSNY